MKYGNNSHSKTSCFLPTRPAHSCAAAGSRVSPQAKGTPSSHRTPPKPHVGNEFDTSHSLIDNDAARASLARSFTRKEEGAAIVFQAVEAEERLNINACFLRVPTSSNIADGPSRGVFDTILRLGGRRIPLPCGAIRSALGLSGAV